MKKMKCVAVSLALCLAAGGCAAGGAEAPPEEILTPVETASVSLRTITSDLVYAGQVSPAQSVQVTGKMGGKVERTYFEVGDYVNVGDVLYSLDKTDIENQIRQLQSQLNVASQGVRAAENSLSTVTGGQYESQVRQLETAVENCKKQLENAEIGQANAQLALDNTQDTYDKVKFLYESGVKSRAEYDNAQFALDQSLAAVTTAEVGVQTARLALEQAENNLALSSGKIVDENVTTARQGISSASASAQSVQVQIDIARSTLRDATVTSPITGVVSGKLAKESETISTQTAAYTIVNMDSVLVKVGVSELIINKLSLGQNVDVYVVAALGEPFTGVITSISPVADQTSMFPLEITIDNPSGELKSGMFAEARFERERSDNVIVLPRSAVLEDDVEHYVFVNENDVSRRVAVTTGVDNGKEIEITSGLSENDEIIVKGQTYVSDGDRINVVGTSGEEAQL